MFIEYKNSWIQKARTKMKIKKMFKKEERIEKLRIIGLIENI